MVFFDPTTWSFPGNVPATLNNGYYNISKLPSAIITRFPTFISCKYDIHICFLVKPRRYSLIHFFQNMSFIACIAFNFALRFMSFLLLQWIFDLGILEQVKNDLVLRILCRWDHWLMELIDDYLRYFLFPRRRCEVSSLLQGNLLKLPWDILW